MHLAEEDTIEGKFTIQGRGTERVLRVSGSLPEGFHGQRTDGGHLCPLDASNAVAIRRALPWTAPVRVGNRKSFGFGDRLGVASPGHLAAAETGDMFPILAQQSIREMQRAGRSAREVLDDAMWAVVETGYRKGWASDADHVKTPKEIDMCVEAGYLGFTFDPGEFVDDTATTADAETLRSALDPFPWDVLESNPEAHRRYFLATHNFSEEKYLRAAAKYGRAMARVAVLDAHLSSRLDEYDVEVSVDETDTATTPEQHRYIALELQRLGIEYIGLAPRFVGAFYKGVDYVGDLHAFEADYADHAAIARELGPYKLSIHSGSDKLGIYPIIARHTPDNVHVKTAGTSWLEALRVMARHDPANFRRLLELAGEGYDANRQSYFLDGRVENIPDLANDELPSLLDNRDARQVLHVAFGAALATFHDSIFAVLDRHLEEYWDGLRVHFEEHLRPFLG